MSHTQDSFWRTSDPVVIRDSDECFTPAWVFETLGIRFDLDVAAPTGGVSWIPCERYLTHENDGLKTEWFGRVWMNPPFSSPQPWVKKFLNHNNGIALLPVSKSAWFESLWNSKASIVAAPPQLKFIKNGQPHGIFIATVFVACGQECIRALSRLGVVR